MHRLALALAFSALPLSVSVADGLPPIGSLASRYLFTGCVQNRSCHTATITFTGLDPAVNRVAYDLALESFFVDPGLILLSQVRLSPVDDGLEQDLMVTGCDLQFIQGLCRTGTSFFSGLTWRPETVGLTLIYGALGDPNPYGSTDFGNVTMTLQSVTIIPEPTSLVLLASGLVGIGGIAQRSRMSGRPKRPAARP